MTRSSANWSAPPGGFDTLHCERRIYPSESRFGIPDLLRQVFGLPADFRLLPYRSRLDRLDPARDCCHFYLGVMVISGVRRRPGGVAYPVD